MANTLQLRGDAKIEGADLIMTDIASTNDADLAASGDAEAFIRLYRAHLTPVFRYLYARLGDRSEAEDVTQQAFERAWSSLASYKPVAGGTFRGWLFTIAHRALADHFRSRARHFSHQPLDPLAGELIDPARGPEEAALVADQISAVLQAINALSEEGREIVTLRFMAELSYREIAQIMGKKEATVKMAAYRALDIIRQKRRNGDV